MRLIEIKDVHDPQLDIFARLSEGQLFHYYEPAEGLFIAESPMIIQRALDAGYVPLSMLAEHKLVRGCGGEVIARCGDIPVYTAKRETLEQITGYALTRGMLCAMRRRPLPDAAQICRGARRVVVLENVMNPTNVGAIFRSAAALGMDGILLTPGSSDPLYRRAVRVAMGTVFQIPWSFFKPPKGSGNAGNKRGDNTQEKVFNELPQGGSAAESRSAQGKYSKECQECWLGEADRNSGGVQDGTERKSQDACGVDCREEDARDAKVQGNQMIRFLHDLGFKTVAMALREDSISLGDPRLQAQERLAIVLGTEGDGLAADTIADCDYTVRIPMAHGVDSLNVAAASAVAFWQLGRREAAENAH